jgi:hypothetical protein
MFKGQTLKMQYEKDMTVLRTMFAYLYRSISETEREDNFHLQRRMKKVKSQLRLCRDLARRIDHLTEQSTLDPKNLNQLKPGVCL